MQSSERVVAQRYCKALFQASAQRGRQEEFWKELGACHRILRDRKFLFVHPLVPMDEKKIQLRRLVSGKAGPKVTRFLEILVEKKRFNLMPLILENYRRMLQEHKGIIRVRVKTALPLDAKNQKNLRTELERFSGRKIALDVKPAPELIGGLMVEMGDWVLDASFRRGLEQLKETFKN